jgi:hypothetical protein
MRDAMRTGRMIAVVATLLGVVALVAACGSDDQPSTSGTKTIRVSFSGSDVTPNGDLVSVSRGQDVKLEVTADKAGEIHVHSDPAKEYQYGVGTTSISLGSFDVPGRIEVESHALEKTIVVLEVK